MKTPINPVIGECVRVSRARKRLGSATQGMLCSSVLDKQC